MRLATAVLIAATATIILASIPVPARGQTTDPTPSECTTAYVLARSERYRLNAENVDRKGYESLLSYVENGTKIDFEQRYQDMKKKFPDDFNVQSAFASGGSASDDMMYSGYVAVGDSVLQPDKVFVSQRPVLARARRCDQIHGFTPVLGAPDMAAIVKRFSDRIAKQVDDRVARLNALDDKACATRFWMMAAANQQNAAVAQEFQSRFMTVAGKFLSSTAPPEATQRTVLEIQRDGTERLTKMGSNKTYLTEYFEDLNECERDNSMPVTPAPTT